MSSVNSASTRNDNNDEIRNLREEYRKKEAELIKKHNREIAASNQRHSEEVDKIGKQHSADLNMTRQKTQETLTQRDARYQKEIEDLRSMYSKQLEKMSQDNQMKVDIQRKASESEAKDTKLSKNNREQELLKNYEKLSTQSEERFRDQLGEIRANQNEAINRQKEMLGQKHENELNQVREDRNERVSNLEKEKKALYESTAERLKDQETRHMADTRRMQDAHLHDMKKEQSDQGELNKIMREGYQDGLRDVRQRFAQDGEKKRATDEEFRQNFHDQITDRVENQVNRLKSEVSDAKEKSVLAETKAKASANREIADMRNAYQTKFDILDKNRRDILEVSNNREAEKVKKVRAETDKQMGANTRYYIEQMQLENFKDRTAREQMTQDFSARQKFQEDRTQGQIAKVRSDSLEAEDQMRNNFEMNVDLQRQGYEEKKKDLVYSLQKDSNTALAQVHDKAEKQEAEHQQNVATIISKYEKRVSDLNDQLVRERRMRDTHERQVIKGMTRQHETDVESVRMKYEEKAKQAELTHQNELKEADRRHQTKLDEVLTSMKKQT